MIEVKTGTLSNNIIKEAQEIAELFWREGLSEGAVVRIEYYDDYFVLGSLGEIEESFSLDSAHGFHVGRELKWAVRRICYKVLADRYGVGLNWGVLTGIRPSKIVHEMFMKGFSYQDIFDRLTGFYFVNKIKAKLLYEVSVNERAILKGTPKEAIGLYVGIPFCPSTCLYCSFTSNPIGRYRDKVHCYLDALEKEVREVSLMIEEGGLFVESLYIGGGTPTSLDADGLERLFLFLQENLDLTKLKEYTVEAGRPDTINHEKLSIIKRFGISRISINPQTMNDNVLSVIGRRHNGKDVVSAFRLARKIGFDNINMDLICGLPEDSLKSFKKSFDEVLELCPENITVHTFSVKRASVFNRHKNDYELSADVAGMVDYAYKRAKEDGFLPYYLYRQRNILGNLENVGYAKEGCESLYNVQIMQERQSIIALGAGAISKIFYRDENRIERIFNVKSVEDYISRIDEMIKRKRGFL